jgi:hypothetical protein
MADPLKLYGSTDEYHNEELDKLAREMYNYASTGLRDLRNQYPKVPQTLKAQEKFYKDIVGASAEYLAETKNWYKSD